MKVFLLSLILFVGCEGRQGIQGITGNMGSVGISGSEGIPGIQGEVGQTKSVIDYTFVNAEVNGFFIYQNQA